MLFVGCFVSAFLGQITAMVLYAFTSSSDGKRRRIKSASVLLVCLFLLYILIHILRDRAHSLEALVHTLNAPLVRLFPVSGWLGSMLTGAFFKQPMVSVLGIVLCFCYFLLLISLVLLNKLDYYEDVLKSTETVHSAITAKKEGTIGEATPRNVKIGKSGIDKGWGSDVFYYKHLIENRRAQIFLLDAPMLIFAGAVILSALFMKRLGIGSVFAFATYMQIFSVALGRINKELQKPYVYLVPEPPFAKLVHCLRESLTKFILEAVLIFLPVSLLMQLHPFTALLCILARISFAALFTAGNLLVERIWGGGGSKALVIVLYVFVMILLSLPGIVLGLLFTLVFSLPFPGPIDAFLLSMTMCNIPVCLLALYIVRNILQYAELNNR